MSAIPQEYYDFLLRLDTPGKIQDFLDSIPFNDEKGGITCMSPLRVLQEKKAHCIEGAMLAAFALSLQGEKPLVMSLKVTKGDDDHMVALYKKDGYWGAISKTNHNVLRFRDPVYRTPRELALSYFHEYFLTKDGKKTMLGYSQPINLRRFGMKWVGEEDDLWEIGNTIFTMEHEPVVSPHCNIRLRPAHEVERRSASIKEWEGGKKNEL